HDDRRAAERLPAQGLGRLGPARADGADGAGLLRPVLLDHRPARRQGPRALRGGETLPGRARAPPQGSGPAGREHQLGHLGRGAIGLRRTAEGHDRGGPEAHARGAGAQGTGATGRERFPAGRGGGRQLGHVESGLRDEEAAAVPGTARERALAEASGGGAGPGRPAPTAGRRPAARPVGRARRARPRPGGRRAEVGARTDDRAASWAVRPRPGLADVGRAEEPPRGERRTHAAVDVDLQLPQRRSPHRLPGEGSSLPAILSFGRLDRGRGRTGNHIRGERRALRRRAGRAAGREAGADPMSETKDTPAAEDRRRLLQEALTVIEQLRGRIDVLERGRAEPIAVVGLGCRFPGGADGPEAFWQLLRDGVDAITEVPVERWSLDVYTATGNAHNAAAGRVAYTLGLHGPAMAVDTACSSSLTAIHIACQSLRQGECSLALAGGVNATLLPDHLVSFFKWGMMAP